MDILEVFSLRIRATSDCLMKEMRKYLEDWCNCSDEKDIQEGYIKVYRKYIEIQTKNKPGVAGFIFNW